MSSALVNRSDPEMGKAATAQYLQVAPIMSVAGEWPRKLEQWSTTPLGRFLGLQDVLNPAIWRAAVIEMVSLWLFVFFSIVVSIGSNYHGFSSPILVIAFFHFIVLSLLIRAAAPPSDAHLNPAVTLSAMFSGKYTPVRTVVYILFQCTGAAFGAICAKDMLPPDEVDTYLLGGCTVRKTITTDGLAITQGLADHQAFVSEFTFSFVLMWMNFCVAMDKRQFRESGLRFFPFLMGATVALNVYVSGSIAPGYGGATMNPARCLGPALVYGGHKLQETLWIFILAPIIAAFCTALLYNVVPPNHVEIYSEKEDFIHQVINYKKGSSNSKDIPSHTSVENMD